MSPGEFPIRCVKDLEVARLESLRAVLEVRRGPARPHIAKSGHERIMLPNGKVVTLITRVDYREESETPLTKQRAAETWDKAKRDRADFTSATMRSMQGRSIVI